MQAKDTTPTIHYGYDATAGRSALVMVGMSLGEMLRALKAAAKAQRKGSRV
jgi:hypothetical protein